MPKSIHPPSITLFPIITVLPPGVFCEQPDLLQTVFESTLQMYERGGSKPPWLAYIAVEHGRVVGACAFKGPPSDNRVEIAYLTFPGNEGRGVASQMAGVLAKIAQETRPGITLTATTPPGGGASASVLMKQGFVFEGAAADPQQGNIWWWARDTFPGVGEIKIVRAA